MDDDIAILLRAVRKILANSKNCTISVIINAKKACDVQKKSVFDRKIKKALDDCSIQLELKIKKATCKREEAEKSFEKLKAQGIKIGSDVICNHCGFRKFPCHVKVIDFNNPYVTVDCKHIFPAEWETNVKPNELSLVNNN